jgi:hypothetical protein
MFLKIITPVPAKIGPSFAVRLMELRTFEQGQISYCQKSYCQSLLDCGRGNTKKITKKVIPC